MTTKPLSLIPPDVQYGTRDLTDEEDAAFWHGLRDRTPQGIARLMATFETDDPAEAIYFASSFV
jgi:hypothetical protein